MILAAAYVTWSGKTSLNRTFCISRNTNLIKNIECPVLLLWYNKVTPDKLYSHFIAILQVT